MRFFRQDLADEELVARIARGDGSAFDELYRRYSRRLLHYFLRMLGEEKAQDFLQELFLKVIENRTSLAGNGCFSTWIFAIAHNMCCNEYRYMAVRQDTFSTDVDRLVPQEEGDNVEATLDHATFKESLLAELDRLDEVRRSTFLLRFQEGFSIREIGEIMGCANGTVKSRLFYTTRLLADRLRAFDPCKDEENQHA